MNLTYWLIAIPAALVVGVLLIVGEAWWTRRRDQRWLADTDTDADWRDMTIELPMWSTLPEPDPDGWSSHTNWSAWTAWLDARRDAADERWSEQVLDDLESSPILAELAAHYLTERPRELTGAET